MIQISQLKLPLDASAEAMKKKIAKQLHITEEQIRSISIRRRSLDARRRPMQYVYTVEVDVDREEKIVKKLKDNNVTRIDRKPYRFPEEGNAELSHRPVIVGSGPAGLFCALMLAKSGYRPIVLERGQEAAKRKLTVDTFWKRGALNLNSNVQFGEGGAGTFSDGKLNTLVKDSNGRNHLVLQMFVDAGAPEEILYEQKPHLGTDQLIGIVEHIRKEIENYGGTVLFEHQMTDLCMEGGKLRAVHVKNLANGEETELAASVLVLAIGHSARDTFAMLKEKQVPMEQKAFAVGVRMEHPQSMINLSQYGENYPKILPAAAYKVTRKTSSGRGVYSFCMCPGGYVVNASSENGRLAVNGMSYQARDSRNANSAMIVTIGPEDFGSDDILAGVEFQRMLEERAFHAGEGDVPIQLFRDFKENKMSTVLGEVEPCIKGNYRFGDVRGIFPKELSAALTEGIEGCEHIIPGFARDDAVLSGVESRTSSPVRIVRGETLESTFAGIYPCGEGAGYAGGITSAAMDGVKVAEEIRKKYKAFRD